MEWFWPEGFYAFLLIAVFAFGAFYWKLPIAVAMALAAITAALAAGEGVPLRHIVEGEFGYVNTILVIATAMILMKVVLKIGLLDAISAWVIRKFRRYPALLSIGLMLIIMVPGMITGSSTASVLTTGALVAPVMMTLGMTKVKTAAVISMGALLGMIAPPISIPAMIICAGVDIPYVGFALPLLFCTMPLAVVYSLTMIYPDIRHFKDEAALEEQLTKMSREPLSLRLSLPVLTLIVLFVVEQVFATSWPGLGMPLIFLISAAAGFLTGVKWNPVETVTEAINDCLPVLGILMGVGMFIQIMTLIGVQGFIVVSALSLPSWTLYLGIVISMPLFGAVSSFGSASVLGVPFLLAMLSFDSVIVASALSLIASLGDLMPPTALAGIFAAQVVGEDNYFKVLKKCLLPGFVLAAWGIAVILYSNTIANFIK
ncbi:MAG: TRAP transporter large permease subunit [Pyramidobacter sp.]|nr:TRAP transporter large permease subunit [Pyramidobacter sp.]